MSRVLQTGPGGVWKMRDTHFRTMAFFMSVRDRLRPNAVAQEVRGFDLLPGMTIVDYGCGPGRYTMAMAKVVGPSGKVYAVDLQPLAVDMVKRRAVRRRLSNVEALLADGYHTSVPDHVADVVCAIDMFQFVGDTAAFLAEVRRMLKPDGVLLLTDPHEGPRAHKERILQAGGWTVAAESAGLIKFRPT